MPHVNRRSFLNASAGFVTATALATAAKLGQAAAAEPLNIAVIGPGGMGTNHLKLLSVRKDVKVQYVCDVDANRLAAAAKVVEQNGGQPKAVKDLRKILDDKSIEAVWIATPDHWHSPAAILAVAAGKHVYVEKPVSHNVREGKLLLDTARRNKRVVQVGTQSRSAAHVREAMEAIKAGEIGDVLVAKAWNSQLRKSIGKQQPSEPPATLDFDLWLGPAPARAYQTNLLPGIWRWWYDFGSGDAGNDGVHDIDIARWGLGVNSLPSSVAAQGGKFFFDDDQQFPDTQYCTFTWPGDGKPGSQRQLIFEQRLWSPYHQEGFENGNAFYGTKGVLILGKHGGWQIVGVKNAPGRKAKGEIDLPAHHQNFLDCIRSGGRPRADVEEGHLSASLAHLGNIACRVNRTLHLDAAAEKITGDEEAAKLLTRKYRPGHWAVPKNA